MFFQEACLRPATISFLKDFFSVMIIATGGKEKAWWHSERCESAFPGKFWRPGDGSHTSLWYISKEHLRNSVRTPRVSISGNIPFPHFLLLDRPPFPWPPFSLGSVDVLPGFFPNGIQSPCVLRSDPCPVNKYLYNALKSFPLPRQPSLTPSLPSVPLT